jgi:gamma-glutamylcyclotransferase (GGCT)/AIG2-like uncharacterized protein YtfP
MTSKQHVFTYGSLMFPEIWRQVVTGEYRSQAAALEDYRRFAVPGATYPGMVAMPGERVAGLLYMDVGLDDLARLDAFEGSDYRRDMVQVTLGSGATVVAGAYVWLDHTRLSDAPWLPEAFRLREFIASHVPGSSDSGG